MQKFLSLVIGLLCFSAAGSRATTVSGTVTNVGLSAPAASQKIYLFDSSASGQVPIDSTNTNSSGVYSFTVSSSISSGNFRIYTIACNRGYVSGISVYSGSNLSINLSICAPITVNGTISYTGSGVAAGMKVYAMDSGSSGVLYRDSTVTNASGQYSFSIPTSFSSYRVYVNACGSRWSSSLRSTFSNATINLTLGCPSQILTDTVKNSSTGLAVYGQKVYLVDSTGSTNRIDSAITNRNGIATFYVSHGVASGPMRIYTNACGVQSQTFTYAGSSMIGPTLSICLSNSVVSGTVTNVSASAVIPNQWVVVTDSVGSTRVFVDTVQTNASGVYSVVLPVSIPASGTIIAATSGCGSRYTSSGTYGGSNMTLNLSICASSIATIYGTVTALGSGSPIAGRKVYYRDTIRPAGTPHFDSTVTNSAGFYSFTVPPTIMAGPSLVTVPTCNGTFSNRYLYYSGSSLIANFQVCSSSSPNTISGTIVSPTGAPIWGATVAVGSTTTTTNSSGAYSLNIPSTFTYGTKFYFNAWDSCGTRSIQLQYTGVNMVRQDTIINTNCHTIGGTVTKQGSGVAANASVYLILETYDSTVVPADTILTLIDSTVTDVNGRYSFTKAMKWSYPQRIKAALQPADPSYWNFLPAYHDSSLRWSGGATFNYTAWYAGANNLNVSLPAGSNPGGPGFIGGSVLVGANKGTAVGDPLAERILILTTANDEPVAYTYSDVSGAFSFPNLPYGTYKLFGDAGGKSNPALIITLSAGSASVNSIVFEENNKRFEGHIGNVSVAPQNLDAVRLYPNPAQAYVMLNGLNSLKGNKSVVVKNVTGATVYTLESVSGDVLSIPTANLPAGIYLLQLHSETGVHSYRFAKE